MPELRELAARAPCGSVALSSTMSTRRSARAAASCSAPPVRLAGGAEPGREPETSIPTPSVLVDAGFAVHQLDQAAHDRQAEPGAAVMARGRCVDLRERLEQALRPGRGGMPMPVSRTSQRIVVSLRIRGDQLARRSTPRRCAVNLMALLPRLSSTWRRRPGSPITHSGSSGIDVGDELESLGVRLDRQQMRDVVDGVAQVDVDALEIELAGFDFREIENVVDDGEQARRRCRGSSRYDRAAFGRVRCRAAVRSCRSRRSSACGFHGSCWRETATSPAPRVRHAPSPAATRHWPIPDPACAAPLARRSAPASRRRRPTRSR